MRTDRELLELAAKAEGWKKAAYQDMRGWGEIRYGYSEAMYIGDDETIGYWNPLTDDGDCARMEAKLAIDVKWYRDSVVAYRKEIACDGVDFRDHGDDRNAARRIASLRVAAEIGKQMP